MYEPSDIKKADADDSGARALAEAAELAKVKKANERADLLKKHYKNKLLNVSKANGSCEQMDDSMDKMENATLEWMEKVIKATRDGAKMSDEDSKKLLGLINKSMSELKLAVLDFAQRSGMQTSGARKKGGDKPDNRSIVEASLAEEVYETAEEYFLYVEERMKAINPNKKFDGGVAQKMLRELHEKNVEKIADLGVERMARSRKMRKNAEMYKESEEACKPPPEPEPEEEPAGRPPGGPMGGGGRGGLLGAIKAGRGGRGGGGRGGLLDAIKGGRGKKKGGGGGGGRGGLLDAIKAGKKKKSGGDGGGGRGGLLAAIAARGGG